MTIKHITLSKISLPILFITILASCKKDDNNTVTSATRDDYIGTWQCDEYTNNQLTGSYTVYISQNNSNDSKVLIENFHQLGNGSLAEGIVDNTNITLPQQVVTSTGGGAFSLTGSGYITNKKNTIELQYTVDSDNYTATYTKM